MSAKSNPAPRNDMTQDQASVPAPGASPAEKLDRLLWEAIDYAAAHPAEARDVDPRTWHHLLTYSTYAVAPAAPQPASMPHPGSSEASAMIDSELAAHNWPSNAKNAARCGYKACIKLLAAARASAQPVLADQTTGALLMGLAVIRELTGTQHQDLEATIEAVRTALTAAQLGVAAPSDTQAEQNGGIK